MAKQTQAHGSARIQEVVIDCAEPSLLASFWAQLLGTRWGARGDDWAVADAGPLLLAFQRVPEPKSSPKNRLHLDIQVPDAEEAADLATALGARRLPGGELAPDGDGYAVMADPEGNEFCFVVDQSGAWESAARGLLGAEARG